MATHSVKSKLSQLKAIAKNQSSTLAKLNNTYDDIINVYQNYNQILRNEMINDDANNKLLFNSHDINSLAKANTVLADKNRRLPDGAILGIEDDGTIRIRRRLEDDYNNGLSFIETGQKENSNAIKLYNDFFSFVLPPKKELLRNTSK